MKILGIETSCDETAAAVVEGKRMQDVCYLSVLSNIVSSQIKIHKRYGGVVPEVAAREHAVNILPVVNEALEKAGANHFVLSREKKISDNKRTDRLPTTLRVLPRRPAGLVAAPKMAGSGIGAIAVTVGPGLITSLIVGVETAKTLAYVWNLPLIAVNHIEGHIYANFIGKFPATNFAKQQTNCQFPIIILTVSGGHTMLILMKGHGKLAVIGDTLDDAAGEAFDKAAAMMKIGYPGGPAISRYADKFAKKTLDNSQFSTSSINKQAFDCQNKQKIKNKKSKITLPRPMIHKNNFNFSFSGLKTSLLYQLQKDMAWEKRISEYCFEFQQAVIDVLIAKTLAAAKNFNAKTIMLAGGVAANTELRRQLTNAVQTNLPKVQLLIPNLEYTTDNAAMIATAGYFKFLRGEITPWQKLSADCNHKL